MQVEAPTTSTVMPPLSAATSFRAEPVDVLQLALPESAGASVGRMSDEMLDQVAAALEQQVQKEKQMEEELVVEKESKTAAAAAADKQLNPQGQGETEKHDGAKIESGKEAKVAGAVEGLMLPESVAAWQQRSGKGSAPARIAVAK